MEQRKKRLNNRGPQQVLLALRNLNGMSTAQDIYIWLKQNEPSAPGMTTIYRALDTLIGMRLIQSMELGSGQKHFECVEPGTHHHHLICQQCQTSIRLEQCSVEELTKSITQRHGFHVSSHVLAIFGLCKECSQD